ncbi:MAG: hypothetical protein ACRDKW_12070 [Actinomycetota bacterium]
MAATQEPSHDVIQTGGRDLFGFRRAPRSSIREASDTVLSPGSSGLGYPVATIDPVDAGWASGSTRAGHPVRLKACHPSEDDLKLLAAREALGG